MVNNPNNWHWVNVNALPWTKNEYFPKFEGLEILSKTNNKYIINSINSINGDSDLHNRKGKIVMIYDLAIEFTMKIVKEDEILLEDLKIEIPEFIHDMELSEIQYLIKNDLSLEFKKELKNEVFPKISESLLKYQVKAIENFRGNLQQ